MAGTRVDRFTNRAKLRAAIRAWCEEQLEGNPAARARAGRSTLERAAFGSPDRSFGLDEQLAGLSAMLHAKEARRLCNDLREALHAAKAFLRAKGERAGATHYGRELARIVDAVSQASAFPPNGRDAEIEPRTMLVQILDTPRTSPASNREVAMLSLMMGNGDERAMTLCARARGVTVLEAVREEEKAVAITRARVAKARDEMQAEARRFDEARAAAARAATAHRTR